MVPLQKFAYLCKPFRGSYPFLNSSTYIGDSCLVSIFDHYPMGTILQGESYMLKLSPQPQVPVTFGF